MKNNNIMKTMYFYGTEEHVTECVTRVKKNNVRAMICSYIIVAAGCLFGATIATSISALVFGNINVIIPIIIATVTTVLTILSYISSKKVNREISKLMAISIGDEITKKMDGVFGRLSVQQ